MAERYDEQAWKTVKATRMVTKYTSLPAGQEFRSYEKDANSLARQYGPRSRPSLH